MQNCKKVTLRLRHCKHGKMSYYLDYYPPYRDKKTMKTIRHEYLGIYIYESPKNSHELAFNKTMEEKAEIIRCRRFEEIINERYNLYDKQRLNESFIDYYEKEARKHNQKWIYVCKHFKNYVNGKCSFGEVDVELCQGFAEYLLEHAQSMRTGERLSNNSVAGYWSTFRGFLRIAYRSRLINENINDYLDRIEYEDTLKESLTLQEIYKLYNTDCKIDVLKRACLFSCFTGLRFSDVNALTWEMVKEYADGSKYLDFLAVKTTKQNIVPINDDALHLMGRKGTGKVFKGLFYYMTQKVMHEWLKAAKIKKHITFHSFRHTFATLQVELGTDIYTVQNMLGHANVTTTEIYARHADAKSKEASQKLSLSLLKSVSTNKKTSENKNSNKENKTITSERKENKRKENHPPKY